MIADAEFRVWALRNCAEMIREMDTVGEAVAYIESIADRLEVEYIADATVLVSGPFDTAEGRPNPESEKPSGAPEPCKCHQNFAYVAPTHSGHCCFLPAGQDCHQQEVAAWEAKRDACGPSIPGAPEQPEGEK